MSSQILNLARHELLWPLLNWWDDLPWVYRWRYARYCGLVEVAKDNVSVGMMRTPAYRFEWVTRLVCRMVIFRLRSCGDTFYVRVTDPDAALAIEGRYAEWLALRDMGVAG